MIPKNIAMWTGSALIFDIGNVLECLKQQLAFNANDKSLIQYDHIGLCGSAFYQSIGQQDAKGNDIYDCHVLKAINLNYRTNNKPPKIYYKLNWNNDTLSYDLYYYWNEGWVQFDGYIMGELRLFKPEIFCTIHDDIYEEMF